MHHCLLAAVGKCAVILVTGTGDAQDSEITDALLAELTKGGNVSNPKAEKAVKWIPLNESDETSVSALAKNTGLIVALVTQKEVASVRWHRKEDCFVTVSPKAGTSACLDPPAQQTKLTTAIQEGKARSAAGLLPSKQTVFVCREPAQAARSCLSPFCRSPSW